jgi:hypothetical protein
MLYLNCTKIIKECTDIIEKKGTKLFISYNFLTNVHFRTKQFKNNSVRVYMTIVGWGPLDNGLF